MEVQEVVIWQILHLELQIDATELQIDRATELQIDDDYLFYVKLMFIDV